MAVDDILQLGGIDIVAGGDDHPLHPLAEVHEAVLIHVAQVAGVQPDAPVVVAAQGGGGLLGVIHIAHHYAGAGDADLALDVRLHLGQGAGLHDLIEGIREGHADGAGPGIVLGGQAGGGDAFGGAVALPDLLSAAVGLQEGVHLPLQLRGQAVAAGEDALQEAQVRPLQLVRPQQGFEQGGHAGDQIGLLLQQNFGVGVHIELGHQNAGAARHQRRVDADAQAEAVEHGHDGEHLHVGDLVHGKAGGGDGLKRQGVEVQVAEHDALGGAGGAAGIEDRAALVKFPVVGGQHLAPSGGYHLVPQGIAALGQLLDGPGALGHGVEQVQRRGQLVGHTGDEDGHRLMELGLDLRHFVIELIQGQDGLGVGHVQIERDLLGGGQGMDHIGDGPDAVEGIEAVQRLGGVGHADGHPVALADAHAVQPLGRRLDALHEFGIGGLLAHEGVGNVIRLPPRRRGHHLIHGGVGIIQGGGRLAVVFQPGGGGGQAHSFSFLFEAQGERPFPALSGKSKAWLLFRRYFCYYNTGCIRFPVQKKSRQLGGTHLTTVQINWF